MNLNSSEMVETVKEINKAREKDSRTWRRETTPGEVLRNKMTPFLVNESHCQEHLVGREESGDN